MTYISSPLIQILVKIQFICNKLECDKSDRHNTSDKVCMMSYLYFGAIILLYSLKYKAACCNPQKLHFTFECVMNKTFKL